MNIKDENIPGQYREKYKVLKEILNGYKGIILAFSGGVDSSFLLATARAAGLEDILAVTLVSSFFTRKEKERAVELAKDLGVTHSCVALDILAAPEVIKNDARRCYYCKKKGFSAIVKAASGHGGQLVHGINLDDLGDVRPGIEAARELRFAAPLVEAGFSKQEIRACSKALGLSVWDLPSQSCLATRIPTGESITEEALNRIETAEAFLQGKGLSQVRVRCHGRLARIETSESDWGRVADPMARKEVSAELKKLGFDFISLDMEGYVTGKMNIRR